MKPFSAIYFIRENKSRCILLMFMLILGYAAYLGGLYVSNPCDNWQLVFDYLDNSTVVYPSNDEDKYSEYQAFTKEMQDNSKVEVIQLGNANYFNWKSIMTFESGSFSYTFLSVEDFKTYCEHMNIECDFDGLRSGSMIMSERFAKNRDLQVGDKIDKNYSDGIYGEFTLDTVTEEDGYTLYFIDEDAALSNSILLFGNGVDGDELYDIVYSLQKKYDVQIKDSSQLETDITELFRTFNMIYIFIIMLMAVILAVTINAAFVGMYQRRNFEFAVYRAIGMSRRRIIGKIVGELLCMDVIALAIGGFVFFMGLYLFNNLVLYPVGLYMRYYHPMALCGLLLCNLMVIIPLVLTRCRQMLKADICEY